MSLCIPRKAGFCVFCQPGIKENRIWTCCSPGRYRDCNCCVLTDCFARIGFSECKQEGEDDSGGFNLFNYN